MNAEVIIWAISGFLFLAGAALLVFRRQLLAMILGLELLLNAAGLGFVYYSARWQNAEGLAIALLVIAVAAAEAVVGLGFLIALSRDGSAAETGDIRALAD